MHIFKLICNIKFFYVTQILALLLFILYFVRSFYDSEGWIGALNVIIISCFSFAIGSNIEMLKKIIEREKKEKLN